MQLVFPRGNANERLVVQLVDEKTCIDSLVVYAGRVRVASGDVSSG